MTCLTKRYLSAGSRILPGCFSHAHHKVKEMQHHFIFLYRYIKEICVCFMSLEPLYRDVLESLSLSLYICIVSYSPSFDCWIPPAHPQLGMQIYVAHASPLAERPPTTAEHLPISFIPGIPINSAHSLSSHSFTQICPLPPPQFYPLIGLSEGLWLFSSSTSSCTWGGEEQGKTTQMLSLLSAPDLR